MGGLTDSRNVCGGDGGHIYEMLEDIIVSSWVWDWARCEPGNGHINNKTFTHKLIPVLPLRPSPALTLLSQPPVRKVL